ncbi:MAG: ROK family protein [Acidimicrobiales bacterium]|nr:ROK family protein [Acidimicrobiales bacterium]
MTSLIAAVEAGGTKFRAAVMTPELGLVDEVRVPTTEPNETLGAVEAFFARYDSVVALGIASFGPLLVDHSSPMYGSIASTPKPGWAGAPLLSRLRDTLGVPTDIQTDVEAAAVAEASHGAGLGHTRVAYVTVGTGIGAAIAIDGVPFRGRDHTELGHIPVKRISDDEFAGLCPFHNDCLEGMAAGPAIAERWNADPETLSGRDDVWDLEAAYLAQLVRTFTYGFAPDIVIFGGGVGTRPDMADRIRAAVATDNAGYAVSGSPLVATAGLGEDAGLIGAAMMAQRLAG